MNNYVVTIKKKLDSMEEDIRKISIHRNEIEMLLTTMEREENTRIILESRRARRCNIYDE